MDGKVYNSLPVVSIGLHATYTDHKYKDVEKVAELLASEK
jgi:hypothetical protein